MKAAVIIPHYNDLARLGVCLRALAPQVVDGVEVVIVDNNSTVDISPMREAYPQFRFVVETEQGAAAARNRGVAETIAERLFFIDSDCVPAEDWIARALEVADRADLVGGRVDTFDETPPPRTGAQAFETVFAFNFKQYIEKMGFSGSGNLLTTRAVFDRVGGFIVGVSEDREWCHRATASGATLIYDDALVVSHPTRTDWPALRRKWRRLTSESFQLNGGGLLARLRWIARAGIVAASPIAHAPRVLRHAKLRDAGERRRALGVLFRIRALRAVWMLGQSVGVLKD